MKVSENLNKHVEFLKIDVKRASKYLLDNYQLGSELYEENFCYINNFQFFKRKFIIADEKLDKFISYKGEKLYKINLERISEVFQGSHSEFIQFLFKQEPENDLLLLKNGFIISTKNGIKIIKKSIEVSLGINEMDLKAQRC